MERRVPSERSKISIRFGLNLTWETRPRALIPATVRSTLAFPAGVSWAQLQGQQTAARTRGSQTFSQNSTEAEVGFIGFPHFQQGVRAPGTRRGRPHGP